MTSERPAGSRLKTYSDHTYRHTTLVRHQGTTIAFAVDDTRRIRYCVLDLGAVPTTRSAVGNKPRSALDVDYWSEEPLELPFPREIAAVGFADLGTTALPTVRQGGTGNRDGGTDVPDDEIDRFWSTTARLTAAEPFAVVSDGTHVFVFRQSVAATAAGALYLKEAGGVTTEPAHADLRKDASDQAVPYAANALLCDRFVLAGGRLRPVREVRYRRSRDRTKPLTAKDSLGTTDMNEEPFYEPTAKLGFAGELTGGRFTALLLPTLVADVRRWQFFVHNAAAERIDAINVEQGGDGRFNTEGTRFYTSPDAQYQSAVLERAPGPDPMTGRPLIPQDSRTGFAESAIGLGSDGYAEVATGAEVIGLGTGAYTVEAWLKAGGSGTILSTLTATGGISLSITAEHLLTLRHGGVDATLTASAERPIGGDYTHVAVVHDGTTATLYVNGEGAGAGEVASAATAGARLLLGAAATETPGEFLAGILDEVRIWNRARTPDRLAARMGMRLVGDEPGLVVYYRFDGGAGVTAYDQCSAALHATLRGTVSWTPSGAPVTENPGIRRDSFRLVGRTVAGGLSAVLYHQQEPRASGHDAEVRPFKRQARVLLTWTASTTGATGRIASLDLAVSADGRIAQVPDVLDLPVVGTDVRPVDPKRQNELKVQIPLLEEEVTALEQHLKNIRDDQKNPDATHQRLCNAVKAEAVQAFDKVALATSSAVDCWIYGTWDHQYSALHLVAMPGANGTWQVSTASGDPASSGTAAQWRLECIKNGKHLWAIKHIASGNYLNVALDDSADLNGVALSGTAAMKNLVQYLYRKDLIVSSRYDSLQTYGDEPEKLWDYAHESNRNKLVGDGDRVTFKKDSSGDRANTKWWPVLSTPITDKAKERAATTAAALRRSLGYLAAKDDPDYVTNTTDKLTAKQADLIAAKDELGRMTSGTKGRSELTLPVVHLGQDGYGLGWAGALLDFTATTAAPSLAVSGTGHLGLYYRDAENRLTGLFYNTNVGRSGKTLAASAGSSIKLTARDSGLDLTTVGVTVAADALGPVVDRCTVTMTSTGGDTETWSLLPRDAAGLTDALNGIRAQPLHVGKVASATADVLTLDADGARRPIAVGDLLEVGGAVFVARAAVERTKPVAKGTARPAATTLSVVAARTGTAVPAAGAAVRVVSYHVSLVAHTRPGLSADVGSRLVTAALVRTAAGSSTVGVVTDGAAADEGVTLLPRWWGNLPGRAVSFKDATTPPALAAGRLSSIEHTDDLTIEAWIKPVNGAAARIVHANSGDSRYTLALGAQTGGTSRPVVLGVGQGMVASRDTVSADRWTHVAAVFEQSWALSFTGRGGVTAPHSDDLDISGDLTIEVFLSIPAFATAQGLISKGHLDDGRRKRVPYQLSVGTDGKLVFAFEDASGEEVRLTSTAALTAGQAHRIAVVRKLGQLTEEKKTKKSVPVPGGAAFDLDVIESMAVRRWSDITFYIDGVAAGNTRHAGAPTMGHPGPLTIGTAPRGDSQQPLTGVISELRVWNTAREAGDVGRGLGPGDETGVKGDLGALAERPQGLVAHWRFEENGGNLARDETGAHDARIVGVRWTKNPDPAGSTFRIHLDGKVTRTTTPTESDRTALSVYGSAQFALGGRVNGAATAERFIGVLEEVRVWRTARTEEQVLDNLFGRLTGDTGDLLAYYQFDDESTEDDATAIRDNGPRAVDLTLAATTAARPEPVMSTAPISSDTPEVRAAFSTGQPRFVQTMSSAAAVGEYADLQTVPGAMTRGVLKRSYAYVQDGVWQLITGYKLGDLVTEWVGQVQFDPQLIGYVEGAPPIPSENLVATRQPNTLSFINATTVEFQQADQVVQSLSSSKETSVGSALQVQLNTEAQADLMLVNAPMGFGVAKPVTEGGMLWRGNTSLEFENGWGNQTDVSEGTTTARSTMVGLSGGWESHEAAGQVDAEGGRRFQPSNTGYALVQSETADVFALRLAHTGALVAYRMLPNPDIPRDWNLLPFAINPRYTKQGTLDGTVGMTSTGRIADPDYTDAGQVGEFSYFKPREAYALKRRIIEAEQRRQAFYANTSTTIDTTDPTEARARGLVSSFVGPIKPSDTDRTVTAKQAEAFAKRDIVNTYVWSADGGFFAETTGTADVVTETTSGTYRFAGSAGIGVTGGIKVFGIGAEVHADASISGGMTRSRSKSTKSARTFAIDVLVNTPGDMQRYDKDYKPVYADGKPVEHPGRVDAYRFMTFYLDSTTANFEDFYGKVVDPSWLDGPDANAAALRQARQSDHKPPCWRVMHRVTFVSRKLPPVVADTAPPLDKALRTVDVSSNYELLRRLEPFVNAASRDRTDVARQVRDAVTVHLPELLPHVDRITEFFTAYNGID